jgi:hypothetical protein
VQFSKIGAAKVAFVRPEQSVDRHHRLANRGGFGNRIPG